MATQAWTGGAYGPEGSWLLAPMLVAGIALLARERKEDGPETGPPSEESLPAKP